MTQSPRLPSIDSLKQQAKRLRADLAKENVQINHSKSLEMIAHQYGYKDWNTLFAALGNGPPKCPVALGERVGGHYLGHPFQAEVISVQAFGSADRYRITLLFDDPVDVVKFDSFSAYRQRVSCVVDKRGITAERTSDGQPHMQLTL